MTGAKSSLLIHAMSPSQESYREIISAMFLCHKMKAVSTKVALEAQQLHKKLQEKKQAAQHEATTNNQQQHANPANQLEHMFNDFLNNNSLNMSPKSSHYLMQDIQKLLSGSISSDTMSVNTSTDHVIIPKYDEEREKRPRTAPARSPERREQQQSTNQGGARSQSTKKKTKVIAEKEYEVYMQVMEATVKKMKEDHSQLEQNFQAQSKKLAKLETAMRKEQKDKVELHNELQSTKRKFEQTQVTMAEMKKEKTEWQKVKQKLEDEVQTLSQQVKKQVPMVVEEEEEPTKDQSNLDDSISTLIHRVNKKTEAPLSQDVLKRFEFFMKESVATSDSLRKEVVNKANELNLARQEVEKMKQEMQKLREQEQLAAESQDKKKEVQFLKAALAQALKELAKKQM